MTDQYTHLQEIGRVHFEHIAELIAAREREDSDTMSEAYEDADVAIQESPLSVEVRTGWYTPSDPPTVPDEFCILIATGGPAVRIRGELDANCEPHRAWLETQDWGTPWMQYMGSGTSDVLLTYARCFYYGES